MEKKKLIGLGTIALLTLIDKVNAAGLTLHTIEGTDNGDLKHKRNTVSGSRSIFNLIDLVNSYIRFAVGFVCFLFMIINGYKLITANGDEKQTKAATSGLIGSVVGIAICLLAYIIVNVAVKLFA